MPGRPRDNPDDLPERMRRVLFPVQRPSAATLAWNWRWELGVLIGLPVAVLELARIVGLDALLAVLSLAVGILVITPNVRRRVRAQPRIVVAQHRLRVGFVESGLHSAQGRLPFLLWTSPDGPGERVWLWLPAGVTVACVEAACPVLAVAACAHEVRARRHERYAHLVELHVLRIPEKP